MSESPATTMPRDELLLIFLIGCTNDIAKAGKITHGKIQLTDKSDRVYRELLASGFDSTLTVEERAALVKWLKDNDPRDSLVG